MLKRSQFKSRGKPMRRTPMRSTGRLAMKPAIPKYTHDQLVSVAREWLRHKYPVVMTELVRTGGECADAMGFNHAGGTALVECKASRADFHADKQKWFRREPDRGMGLYRYFLTPTGLLSPDELPAGWGLVEWNGRYTKIQQNSVAFTNRNDDAERGVLVSLLRRLGMRTDIGVSIRCYSFTAYEKTTQRESVNKATLSVLESEGQ